MSDIGEYLGNLLIPWPVLHRKSPKLPDFAKLNRFEDRERPGIKIKEYQIKYAVRKHVKVYQVAAKTINVAAKCIREYLEQRPKAREIEYLSADSQEESKIT